MNEILRCICVHYIFVICLKLTDELFASLDILGDSDKSVYGRCYSLRCPFVSGLQIQTCIPYFSLCVSLPPLVYGVTAEFECPPCKLSPLALPILTAGQP